MDARSHLAYTEQLRLWPQTVPGDFQPVLELYLHPGTGRRPCILICPGGGYSHRAAHEGVDIAEAFNELGFHAAVVQYRVAPAEYPEPMRDAFRALKLLRAKADQWLIDKNAIAACGFSAGGHLAAALGTLYRDIDSSAGDEADAENQRPDALILGYPVLSFVSGGHAGSGQVLCGKRFIELRRYLSLETHIDRETPPSFLWHTAADNCVPVENSLLWTRRLAELGISVSLHVFPEGRHGLGLAPEYPDIREWPRMAAEWLKHHCGFVQKG